MKDQITIAQLLASRHSVRKFQPDFKISDEDLNLILEAARMAPSSFGILNSRVIAIENNQMRRELLPLFFYQESFKQSSAYLLFIVDKGQFILSESIFKAEKYIQSPETMTKYQIDLANIVGM
jgi:nitroreductase